MAGPILLKANITPQPLDRVESAGRRRFPCYKVTYPRLPAPMRWVLRCRLWASRGAPRSKPPFLREGGVLGMAWVRVKENEPLDSAIRRFKKQCEKAGILSRGLSG